MPKVTFPRAAPCFPTGSPSEGGKIRVNKRSELHIGMRKWRKIEIPKWNINNKDSGRSDDRTCRRIPFKNTQSGCWCVQKHVPVLLCPAAQLPSISPSSLLPISPWRSPFTTLRGPSNYVFCWPDAWLELSHSTIPLRISCSHTVPLPVCLLGC